MAGTYTIGPDGRIEVTMDGRTFPTSLSEAEAKQAGLTKEATMSGEEYSPAATYSQDPSLLRSFAATEEGGNESAPPPMMSQDRSAERMRYALESGEMRAPSESTGAAGSGGGSARSPLSGTGNTGEDYNAQKGEDIWRDVQRKGLTGTATNLAPAGSTQTNAFSTKLPRSTQTPDLLVRGSAGRRVPAGWVPGTRQTEGTIDDEQSLDRLRKAVDQQGRDQSVKRQLMADAFADNAEQLRQDAAINREQASQWRAQIDQSMASLEADRAQIAGMKVDPSKVWSDRGAFASILAAVSMAAGQYGQALRGGGGKSAAVQIIDDMIDRDIDAQKAAIQMRQQGMQTKMVLLDRYMKNHDPETAERMARASLREAVSAELAQKEAEGDVAAVKSDNDVKMAQIDADLSKQRIATSEQFQPARTVGGSAGGRINMQLMEQIGAAKDGVLGISPRQALKLQNQYYGGRAGQLAKEGAGGKKKYSVEAVKMISQGEEASRMAKDLSAAIKQQGRGAVEAMRMGTGDLARKYAQFQNAVLRLESGAAITEGDRQMIDATIGGLMAGNISPDASASALDRWAQKMDRTVELAGGERKGPEEDLGPTY